MSYTTKTEIYQKIKKPLLERQRRARINKCLDAIKQLVVELQGNKNILRMDKAEMLESTIIFLRSRKIKQKKSSSYVPVNTFRNGYINAVNEVSRLLASTPGVSVDMGKSVMTHLGRSYNLLQQQYHHQRKHTLTMQCAHSPASSGYHSDNTESPLATPTPHFTLHFDPFPSFNAYRSNSSFLWRLFARCLCLATQDNMIDQGSHRQWVSSKLTSQGRTDKSTSVLSFPFLSVL
uniref:BHLH domain-containing protein n=1 Tax=Glossina brevipalpis TaxID=37001 RepID=A0A1A9X2P3_9MUSC